MTVGEACPETSALPVRASALHRRGSHFFADDQIVLVRKAAYPAFNYQSPLGGVLWLGAGQVSLHVSTAKRSISSSKSRLVSKRLTAR
jgi:hypothetical protein